MNIELDVLAATILLGFFQLFLAGAAETRARGQKWNLSSRDAAVEPLPGKAGRIKRAFRNFRETFPFFCGGGIARDRIGTRGSRE